MASLVKQVVLVTGCSTGIGRALVRELRAAGHRPMATARRLESIADLAGEGVETLRLDVCDPPSVAAAVNEVVARAGRLDVVINNAGVTAFGPIAETPLDKIRSLFETNVMGLLAVTQAVFPQMAEQRRGLVVNFGSIVGLVPVPFATGYCASKSAVHMLSEGLRIEAKPFGIDVVVVQPGAVKSSIADSGAQDIERYRAADSRYARFYEGIRKCAYSSQDDPMPAEDFARELVAKALTTPAPRTLRLGTGARYLAKLAEMQGEPRDALLASGYGLDASLP
jgi:NADP-dependent 3-hydroxy acid dehydrogenase YdfG